LPITQKQYHPQKPLLPKNDVKDLAILKNGIERRAGSGMSIAKATATIKATAKAIPGDDQPQPPISI
jgi:hypothetical protein